ncbi:MAG: GNAT family N-acetyltransferase [Planctomycetes bacterium]|nr:GNAT family N-acetyltransferase [Planctomycetota bacterium]
MPNPFLESARLWYRAPEPEDAKVIAGYLMDPRVRRNLAIGRFPFSEAGEAKWIEAQTKPPVAEGATDVTMVVGIKGEQTVLGGTGLHRISWLHRHAEWGVYIGRPDQWGKGYGREMARTTLKYAFDVLNLNRVMLRVNADNIGGIKSYEAAGFVREGVQRQAMYVEGKYLDTILMGVLRQDWRDPQ